MLLYNKSILILLKCRVLFIVIAKIFQKVTSNKNLKLENRRTNFQEIIIQLLPFKDILYLIITEIPRLGSKSTELFSHTTYGRTCPKCKKSPIFKNVYYNKWGEQQGVKRIFVMCIFVFLWELEGEMAKQNES